MNDDGAGAPDAEVRREIRDRPCGKAPQRAVRGRQDVVPDGEGRSPAPARAEHDRQQLGGREGVRAEVDQPFARPFGARKFPDCECHWVILSEAKDLRMPT